jgi:non-specific serine/threonine protein kinase
MIGTTIGHYQIRRLLGRGGMGEVYEAEDTRLGRRVALKFLPKHLATAADRRERFEREARSVAALNHPSIVTIFSIEEHEGGPFLTMELVDGTTVSDRIAARKTSLDWLLTMAIPLADAVAAAHQRGILHRDLKPGNVMVGADGRVKVLDFGLAKLREEAAAVSAGAAATALSNSRSASAFLPRALYNIPN